MKKLLLLAAVSLSLAACEPPAPRIGPDGKPLPVAYKIPNEGKVQFRMLDSTNVLRASAGVGPLQLDADLNAAAATHSRDMAVQNRPWHFGSDGSSPLDRVARTGYNGVLAGENISETYETELQTLSAWMSEPDTRRVILDPAARDMGFAWFQEKSGKIWWTMVTGRPRYDYSTLNVASN
ncbi:CAP domain-containing protein [Falsihalocynthiibacter sp. SS001]|uniref:CAP domain-containing protein n=1 Tax=Falsihalocynthiibacter sp. SS001 TaxID=3349698 RepID=UPI0036D27CFE